MSTEPAYCASGRVGLCTRCPHCLTGKASACGDKSPTGFVCTKPHGHAGQHVDQRPGPVVIWHARGS